VAQLDRIKKIALASTLVIAGTAILAKSSESRWRKVASGEGAGAFSVLMPEKPKVETETLTVNGVKMEAHSLSAWSRANGHFSVTYADAQVLPAIATPESILDAQRHALTQGDEKRMLSAESLIVNGYPVRQYKAIAEDGSQTDERVYLVKRRLYILLVVHDRNGDEADVKKFFDSFTFEPRE
jgi:hypothetical protein